MNPSLLIVNESSLIADDEVLRAIAAVQRQVREHVAPAWSWVVPGLASASLSLGMRGAPLPPTDYIRLVDLCPDPEDLGYHVPDGTGIVGVKSAIDDGMAPSEVLGHETIETLVNPALERNLRDGASLLPAEPCDPVNGHTYEIDGVVVPNFVTPAWFRSGSSGPWDHLGALRAARTVLDGGYYDEVASDGSWQEHAGAKILPSRATPHPVSRRGRLRRHRHRLHVAGGSMR